LLLFAEDAFNVSALLGFKIPVLKKARNDTRIYKRTSIFSYNKVTTITLPKQISAVPSSEGLSCVHE
jgi:hypothetical protein